MNQPMASMDTRFIQSVNKLSTSDAARVWGFLDKFMKDPELTGTNLEHIRRGKDYVILSARIHRGVRAIIYQQGGIRVLVHADQHDAAYDWAEGRRFDRHRVTGELQILPERAPQPEPVVWTPPTTREAPPPEPLFLGYKDD